VSPSPGSGSGSGGSGARSLGSAAGSARLTLVDPTAGPEEAAAIVAALERFIRDTAPTPAADSAVPEGWRLAGLREGVEREPRVDVRDPWINT
jgi:hypothetical protein